MGNGFNGCLISFVCYIFYLIFQYGVKREEVGFAGVQAMNFKTMMGFTVVYVIVAVYSIYTLISYNSKYPKLLSRPEI